MADSVPVVDFSCLNLDVSDDDISEDALQQISSQLIEILSSVGFVYLSHTAVPDDLVSEVFTTSKEFFLLPTSVKSKWQNENAYVDTAAWTAAGQESFDPNRPPDLRETFDIKAKATNCEGWPNYIADLMDTLSKFHSVCSRLAHRVLFAIAVGLKLVDRDFFKKNHHFHKTAGSSNLSEMRVLYYPAITGDVNPDASRLGEHTDCGTVTLLFQDDAGGLQVKGRDGDWIGAHPIPSTVLVNIADLLQRWTSDRLVSTPHRILLPAEESERRRERQSVVFFVNPDAETRVICLNGSNKYDPVTAGDYLAKRLSENYMY